MITGIKDSKKITGETGFTLLEALVALGLLGVVMTMVVGHVISIHEGYHTDVVRTRINSNLRSAMDMIAMNIRQAGENLQSSFPAVLLEDGGPGNPDILRLRRNRISEVLALCQNLNSGESVLPVSRDDNSVAQCVNSNVQSSYDAFEKVRIEDGGISRVFIYDRSSKKGEFLDYTGATLTGDVYYLSTGATTTNYPALTTAIYLLEEYRFSLDTADDTLLLHINGEMDSSFSVAFELIEFDINLEMDDGVEMTALAADHPAYDWKNLRHVEVSLRGESERKGVSYDSAISASYFPRNVLSYDG